MTIDVKSLNDNALKVLHNSDEFVRKWMDFVSAPAGNVTLEYYDKNGNLQTAVFSNRNKLVQDFISNVNSAMSKTFYVDSVNGDDNNDGSSSAPFKTIKKACDSVPIGGYGTIYLYPGQTYTIDQGVSITSKNLVFKTIGYDAVTYQNNAYIENVSSVYASSSNITTGFSLDKSLLYFYFVNFRTANLADNTLPLYNYSGGLVMGTNISVITLASIIELGDTDFIRSVMGGYSMIDCSFHSCHIRQVGSNRSSYIVASNGGTVSLGTYNSNDIILSNGSSGTWTDIISGIVRDANGVPRNVVSNIVL